MRRGSAPRADAGLFGLGSVQSIDRTSRPIPMPPAIDPRCVGSFTNRVVQAVLCVRHTQAGPLIGLRATPTDVRHRLRHPLADHTNHNSNQPASANASGGTMKEMSATFESSRVGLGCAG